MKSHDTFEPIYVCVEWLAIEYLLSSGPFGLIYKHCTIQYWEVHHLIHPKYSSSIIVPTCLAPPPLQIFTRNHSESSTTTTTNSSPGFSPGKLPNPTLLSESTTAMFPVPFPSPGRPVPARLNTHHVPIPTSLLSPRRLPIATPLPPPPRLIRPRSRRGTSCFFTLCSGEWIPRRRIQGHLTHPRLFLIPRPVHPLCRGHRPRAPCLLILRWFRRPVLTGGGGSRAGDRISTTIISGWMWIIVLIPRCAGRKTGIGVTSLCRSWRRRSCPSSAADPPKVHLLS